MIDYDYMMQLRPEYQALLGTLFTWLLTAMGAALVFLFKTINQKIMDSMMGFAAGVMIAASFWSLLEPSISMASELGFTHNWMPALVGFISGGIFIFGIDKILPHLHPGLQLDSAEGISTTWRRSILLMLAITLHNIPEGLAIGVAFGATAAGVSSASFGAAIALTIGIGIQNFPEGAAVSLPVRQEGYSRTKSFMYGQASALVEPVAAFIGAVAVLSMQQILPFALAFAAGAMMYVVIEELIPASHLNGNEDLATFSAICGFAIMMTLDVALG